MKSFIFAAVNLKLMRHNQVEVSIFLWYRYNLLFYSIKCGETNQFMKLCALFEAWLSYSFLLFKSGKNNNMLILALKQIEDSFWNAYSK